VAEIKAGEKVGSSKSRKRGRGKKGDHPVGILEALCWEKGRRKGYERRGEEGFDYREQQLLHSGKKSP